jgi:hypothetical protein
MTYLNYLQDTAYAIPSTYVDPIPKIENAELYFSIVLDSLDPSKITRNGLDEMLDILFDHEDMIDFVTDLSYQTRIEIPKKIRKYWEHIIIPAWNQQAQLQEVKRNTR